MYRAAIYYVNLLVSIKNQLVISEICSLGEMLNKAVGKLKQKKIHEYFSGYTSSSDSHDPEFDLPEPKKARTVEPRWSRVSSINQVHDKATSSYKICNDLIFNKA